MKVKKTEDMVAYRKRWAQENPEKARRYAREYRHKNREVIRARQKEWREKNREHHNARSNDWRKRNPEKAEAIRRKYKFGIEPEQFNLLRCQQGGMCAICRVAPATHVDHSHSTQKVRGLLCHGCNTGIGFLKENTTTLRNAIDYLNLWAS